MPIRANLGLSPLFKLAIKAGTEEAVSQQISKGADVNGKDSKGRTPLMLAAKYGQKDICSLLLNKGADFNQKCPNGKSAIQFARESGFRETEELLEKQTVPDGPPDPVHTGDVKYSSDCDEWEEEPAVQPPAHNEDLQATSEKIHDQISSHKIVIREQNWEEVEFTIPDRATADTDALSNYPYIAKLINKGLYTGSVTIEELYQACTCDFDKQPEQAFLISLEYFPVAGILIDETVMSADEEILSSENQDNNIISDLIDTIHCKLTINPEEQSYLQGFHGFDQIDKLTEIRLAQKMDSALLRLARALITLPADMWIQLTETTPRPKETDNTGDTVDISQPDHKTESAQNSSEDTFTAIIEQARTSDRYTLPENNLPRPSDVLSSRMYLINKNTDYETQFNEATNALNLYIELRNRFITSNVKLVFFIAKRYLSKGLELDDLVQEGTLGLKRAVEKFDYRKGWKFSTYATIWIRQSIERAIMNQTRMIRIPIHVLKELNTVLRASRELAKGIDHEPTAKDIARQLKKPVEGVDHMLRLNERVSLIENSVLDLIHDEKSREAEELIQDDELTGAITILLQELNPKQRDVIARRFGLLGYEASTLENVGSKIGLTRERVRQIQVEALKRIKSTEFIREQIEGYMHG